MNSNLKNTSNLLGDNIKNRIDSYYRRGMIEYNKEPSKKANRPKYGTYNPHN